jgi:hypothetical protein
MKYTLNAPDVVSDWKSHEFYQSAIVLGVDSGIDGIGICLRKGPEILFAHTFLVGDTTKTLEERRLKRGWRRARKGRKKRESLLKDWVVRHKILSKERVNEIWHDPKVFQNAFKHRLRGMEQKLGSGEALVSCLRHAIQHRGFDYHLNGGGGFPWGDAMDFSKIIQWAKTGCCPQGAVDQWMLLISEADFAADEKKMTAVTSAFAEAVDRFEKDEIASILKEHFKEEKHTNLRPAARGYHFPRELIKAHVRKIWENNKDFFASTDSQKAINELIGPNDNQIYEWKKDGCIIDYHRKTIEEVEKLWERKTNECPYLSRLVAPEAYKDKVRCSLNEDLAVRKFKALQFLAERTFVLSDGLKYNATKGVFDHCIQFIESDAKAITDKVARPKLDKKELKDFIVAEVVANGDLPAAKKAKKTLQKKNEHNDAFLDQLYDLLSPKRSSLKQRATLSSEAATILFRQSTSNGTEFSPVDIISDWESTYYLWRLEPKSGGRVHPHVQYLLGHPKQYPDGKSSDIPFKGDGKHAGARLDGKAQEHGILRKLFAGQLQDAMGRTVDLSAALDGKTVPDYVIIETIGEIPTGPLQKKAIEDRQKSNRAHKEALAKKYDLGDNPRRSDLLRVILFEQQIVDGGTEAICPVSGQNLGSNPQDARLQIAHIFPNSKGGVFERLNLFITTAPVNNAMDNRTPKGCSGQTIDGVKFLEWSEMRLLAGRKMKWGKQKRDLFLKETDEIPEWENLTRISQLARQLKVEVERWLGLNKMENSLERTREAFRRIGTPTGSMTAACRYSWKSNLPSFMAEKKHRCYLRHHLYDAIVLSHIPSGVGMNFVGNGGIFKLSKDKRNNPVLSAIEGLLPDLEAFEKANAENCLVHKHRSKNSKRSRAEQAIYSKVTKEQGNGKLALKVRKPIIEKNKTGNFVPAEDVDQWLNESGIPLEKLPPKLVEKWKESNGSKPLRLVDGTPVESVPVSTTSEKITSLFPHRNRSGEIIGFKTTTEAYAACQIWEGPKRSKDGSVVLDAKGQPVLEYLKILVPPARNLASYKKQFGTAWKPDVAIPKDFRKVGQFKKGDILTVPLDSTGNISISSIFSRRLYRVSSIEGDGRIRLMLAEFQRSGLEDSPWVNLKSCYKISLADKLLMSAIINLNSGL